MAATVATPTAAPGVTAAPVSAAMGAMAMAATGVMAAPMAALGVTVALASGVTAPMGLMVRPVGVLPGPRGWPALAG